VLKAGGPLKHLLLEWGTEGHLYLYDAEGRGCAVKGAPVDGISAMTGYVYDADGNRVAKGTITQWSCDPTTNGFETSGNETDYVLNQSGQTVTETVMGDTATMQEICRKYGDMISIPRLVLSSSYGLTRSDRDPWAAASCHSEGQPARGYLLS
jgi:hypothetical protein